MVTKRIDIHNMQVLKEYLQLLLTPDTEIILTENGHPVARVTPVQSSQTAQAPRQPNLFPGMWISDDFSDPLVGAFGG